MLMKTVYPNGDEQCKYPDGNVEYWNDKEQTKTIYFANGEAETHTKEWKVSKALFSDLSLLVQINYYDNLAFALK